MRISIIITIKLIIDLITWYYYFWDWKFIRPSLAKL